MIATGGRKQLVFMAFAQNFLLKMLKQTDCINKFKMI